MEALANKKRPAPVPSQAPPRCSSDLAQFTPGEDARPVLDQASFMYQGGDERTPDRRVDEEEVLVTSRFDLYGQGTGIQGRPIWAGDGDL